MPVPQIDPRTYEQIIAQIEAWAEIETGKAWQHHAAREVAVSAETLTGHVLAEEVTDAQGKIPAGTLLDAGLVQRLCAASLEKVKVIGHPPGQPIDAGGALIRIFGRYMETIVSRLNQVPGKNYLAFLNLIGANILPPQPARVPLTFQLVAKSPVNALVPAGTQVAASPTEGDKEVVFETEQDLIVTRTQLRAVFAHEPALDRYGDYTIPASGLENEVFMAFRGNKAVEHEFYLGDEMFGLPAAKTVTLTFASPDASQLGSCLAYWSIWDGQTWQALVPDSQKIVGREWVVVFSNLPVLTRSEINGLENWWLKVQPDRQKPLSQAGLPKIEQVSITATVTGDTLPADLAFNNGMPLDLSKDFYPFGEHPCFGDCLYLSSREAFARPGTSVTTRFTATTALPLPPTPRDLKIQWEMWDGSLWQVLPIETSPDQKSWTKSESGKPTEVAQFLKDGFVRFTIPAKTAPGTFFGNENYWLRVRILSGTFQQAAYDRPLLDKTGKEIKDPDGKSVYVQVPARFAPPALASLTLAYANLAEKRPISACQSCNAFSFTNQAVDNLQGKVYSPFTLPADTQPALYLGFDARFDNSPVTLYAQVEQPQSAEVTRKSLEAAAFGIQPPQLAWHYSGPGNLWKPLRVIDGTQAISNRGLIQFIGPPDLEKCSLFGQNLYWVRVRLESGRFPVPARLRRLLLNTTWASQLTTVRNELLGSSNGNPEQSFQLAQIPLLPGLLLDVREPEMPAPDEQAHIRQAEGQEAITIALDASGNLDEIWVRWSPVTDFHNSGPRDRHYSVDYLTGTIRFGDGRYGRVPPIGQNNIRATRYPRGGGAGGNRPAGTIIQLKSSIPYIDKVVNFEAASGGAGQQPLEHVKRYAPRQLRHRNHAVTAEDFEDLAFAASSDIARAKAIPPLQRPLDLWLTPNVKPPDISRHKTILEAGKIQLMIVPGSDGPQPVPSIGLLNQVKTYLQARCPIDTELWVTGPDWVKVSVTTEVCPVSMALATQLPARVATALERFLHPLTGGPSGKGWPFGRQPRPSDLYALIESVEGVDHVVSLSLVMSPLPDPSGTSFGNQSLIYSGQHDVKMAIG